jgi:alcohol dehydrogenase (cytochrome c)
MKKIAPCRAPDANSAGGRSRGRLVRVEPVRLDPIHCGVARYGDKVYRATMDACVVALQATTGEVVWDKCVIDGSEG